MNTQSTEQGALGSNPTYTLPRLCNPILAIPMPELKFLHLYDRDNETCLAVPR